MTTSPEPPQDEPQDDTTDREPDVDPAQVEVPDIPGAPDPDA